MNIVVWNLDACGHGFIDLWKVNFFVLQEGYAPVALSVNKQKDLRNYHGGLHGF